MYRHSHLNVSALTDECIGTHIWVQIYVEIYFWAHTQMWGLIHLKGKKSPCDHTHCPQFKPNEYYFYNSDTILDGPHCHENYTHLDWIEANECCHMVISSLLNVSVLTSECKLRSKFQHISALIIEYISTHDRIYLHSWLSISALMIEINVVPSKKIVPLSTT